jgi:eukaryotic-like serine/threonine-protein kinase
MVADMIRPIEGLVRMSDPDPASSKRVPDLDATRASSEGERHAAAIGPYRLLRKVGEGGMGEVWLADQTRPVQRQVAVKVIKAGMDTAQVVARFEAERQALAMMDHPAIAKVFDGGSHARRAAVLRDGVRAR